MLSSALGAISEAVWLSHDFLSKGEARQVEKRENSAVETGKRIRVRRSSDQHEHQAERPEKLIREN
jgi:hypothetical protein